MTERSSTFAFVAAMLMLAIGALFTCAAVGSKYFLKDVDLGGYSAGLFLAGMGAAASALLHMHSSASAIRLIAWFMLAIGAAAMLSITLDSLNELSWAYFTVPHETHWILYRIGWVMMYCVIILLLPVAGAVNRIIRTSSAILMIGLACIETMDVFFPWVEAPAISEFFESARHVLQGVVGLCLLWLAASMFLRAKHRLHGCESSLPSRVRLDVSCPRCGERHSVAPGQSECPGCRLRFRLELEEQRCACGYLLVGLAAETCPECGREIPESQRWRCGEEDSDSAGMSPESSRVSPRSPQDGGA